jgi:RND family efflux transporter MFP subunit
VKTLLSILLGVALLAGAFAAVKVMAKFRPEAVVVEKPRLLTSVETLTARSQTLTLVLPSQGIIEAARSSTLAAEVPGRIVEVSPKFEVGGLFSEGDLIVRLEDADYQSALTQAEATLAEARAALASEQARAEQGEREWKKLGSTQPASDLVLRKPQLASSNARVSASLGAVEKARRDLDRTRITAPFACRIRAKRTELGSYLTPGAAIAEVTSTSPYRVRLPLSVQDLVFVPPLTDGKPHEVTLHTEVAGTTSTWKGTVIRTEGEVERASRSVHLVAETAAGSDDTLLQPGLFVQAKINGTTLKNIYRIPRAAFPDQDHLILVDSQNRLRFTQVEVVRPDGTDLLVSAGLKDGDRICLTTLSSPVEGMEVRPLEPAPAAPPPGPAGTAGTTAP